MSMNNNDGGAETEKASNVIPFRRGRPDGDHPYEIVEIFPHRMMIPEQFWIALAGPRLPSGSRSPWHHVASVDWSDPAEAVRVAEQYAIQYRIPIVDLCGIIDGGGPRAKV